MNISFENKRVLVTGAGRGIGRQVVTQLVSAGARVVALSKTLQNLESLKAAHPSVETVCVDLSDWQQTKTTVESLGDIDLLVNNAAFAELTPFGDIEESIIDKHIDINVKPIINLSQIVAKSIIRRGCGGSIVNVSSVAGLVALKDHLVYGASKACLDLITKQLALELGAHNIRVNSICPTVTMTEMAEVGWSDPVKRDTMLKKIPLNSFAKPEDVANTILYLLSDKSNMITGAILPIDGGFTAT